MIGRVDEVERRDQAEPHADRSQEVQGRELISRAAEEGHGHRDLGEVLRPPRVRLPGLV